MPSTDLLFVYGTLCRPFDSEGCRILDTHATFVGEASIEGRLYVVEGLPALVVEQEDRVAGELYRLEREPGVALASLDRYEGAAGDQPGPYERTVREVERASGSISEAWVYAWQGGLRGAVPVLSGDYRDWVGVA